MPFREDPFLSLLNTSSRLGTFELVDEAVTSRSANETADTFLPELPSFKSTTNDHIIYLRTCIKNKQNLEQVIDWSEKLLRFCEIRLASLKTRLIEKCRTIESAKLHGLMLCALFLDLYEEIMDLRLLNIALKLADQKWMVERSTLMQRLKQRGADFQLGTLELRVISAIEEAIGVLKNE